MPNTLTSRTSLCAITALALANVGVILFTPNSLSAEKETPSPQSSNCELTIVGDDTERNDKTLFYYATGHALASIEGQDSKVEADTIRYSGWDNILDARGNVRFIRNHVLSTYSIVRFQVGSQQFLLTKPGSTVVGPTMVTRKKN